MKYAMFFLLIFVLISGFISCGASSDDKDNQSGTEMADSDSSKSEVEVPTDPLTVAKALSMLEKMKDKTITVSAMYIGNYGSGEMLTFRLVDSTESTEELECVFEINDSVDLSTVEFGQITIKGIVWNNQLVKCEIIKE